VSERVTHLHYNGAAKLTHCGIMSGVHALTDNERQVTCLRCRRTFVAKVAL